MGSTPVHTNRFAGWASSHIRNLQAGRGGSGRGLMEREKRSDLSLWHMPRIAFKAKGSILLLDLADILAVQAEGNYVSLRPRTNSYLVHESLSSMAEKLKPFGFIRIHRSVVVNISAVEEIQSLPTGEYRLRVKGGKEYLVTRTYKHNLRDLAQLWVGSERLCD